MLSNKLLFCALILSILYLSCDSLSSGQTNYENAINKSNKYLEDVSKDNLIPGVVAGVSINGTQVWAHAVGLTDIENEVKTRVDSVWRMASISKSLTSALVGRLVDQGRIDLNKSIHEYLSERVFPRKKWNNKNVTITVGQVMSHTAGLHVMKWPTDLYQNLIFKNVTETIASFKDEPLIFEPGSPGHFNYSNDGFQLVGAMLESVLNETYESAINKMFLELEMKSTFCERRERIIPNRVRYYKLDPTSEQKLKLQNTGIVDDLMSSEARWPSGGILSTVPDLLKFGSHMIRWSKGLNDSKTFNLSPGAIKQLWTSVTPISFPDFKLAIDLEYGHGWFIEKPRVPIVCTKCVKSPIKEVFGHSGSLDGMQTLYMLDPNNDIAVAVFFNRVQGVKIHEIAFHLIKLFLN